MYVCTQGSDDDYQFGPIYVFNKRDEKERERERERERQLLVFFLSFSSFFFIFYSTSKHTYKQTLLMSLIRCKSKSNCIFLVVQYLPINCSQINHPDARQLNATMTDGFDKHTRGTFKACSIASQME
jgi:hypothetical protein